MNCPKCHNMKARVIDSRYAEGTKRRRRKCEVCGHRWTTWELPFPDFEDQEQDFESPIALLADLGRLKSRWRNVAFEVIRGLLARQAMFEINKRDEA